MDIIIPELFWEYYNEEWTYLLTKPPKYIPISFDEWIKKRCNDD